MAVVVSAAAAVVSSAVAEVVADSDTGCAVVVVAAAVAVGERFGRTGAEASRTDLLAGGDPTEVEEAGKCFPGCS